MMFAQQEVQVVVKHTFVEFKCEDKCQLQRFSSSPSLTSLLEAKFEDKKCPEPSTPTTCVSENDDSDTASIPESVEYSFDLGSPLFPEVKSIVKNTFIEFKALNVDAGAHLHRSRSVPPSGKFESFRTIKSTKSLAKDTVVSVAGELDLCDSLESLCPERIVSWAECATHELEDVSNDSPATRRGGRVRSGRARQREARRRRMRTPSPERM
jgi:hypothetical protein